MKTLLTKLIFLILLSSYADSLMGQEKEVILLSGRVTNEKNQPLTYVHVLVKNQYIGTITNETGNFFLPVNALDTLIFSYIGYNTQLLVIPDTLQFPFFSRIIKLDPGIYDLNEVTIRPYPKNEKELKQAIINFKEKDENAGIDLNIENVKSYPIPEKGTGFGVSIPGPISILYDLFSREAKQKREYERLVKQDLEKEQVEKRINRELLKKITGFNHDTEIDDFINYCEIASYLKLKPIDYDLYMLIIDCLKYYKRN